MQKCLALSDTPTRKDDDDTGYWDELVTNKRELLTASSRTATAGTVLPAAAEAPEPWIADVPNPSPSARRHHRRSGGRLRRALDVIAAATT